MVFEIVNTIAFRSEDGAMWNIAQPDRKVSLTAIPARLFTYFLENTDKVIGREELFNNIWDKYGLEPSSNSVNQYLSLIRKSLIELGCEEEIIKTLPRVGFYIAGERVSRSEENNQMIDPVQDAPPSSSGWGHALFQGYTPWVVGISCIISALLVTHLIDYGMVKPDYAFPKSTLYRIGAIETCPVYSLYNSSPGMATRKERIANMLSATHITCMDDSMFIFQPDEHYMERDKGRAFLTRCTYSDSSLTHFSNCRDLYIYAQ